MKKQRSRESPTAAPHLRPQARLPVGPAPQTISFSLLIVLSAARGPMERGVESHAERASSAGDAECGSTRGGPPQGLQAEGGPCMMLRRTLAASKHHPFYKHAKQRKALPMQAHYLCIRPIWLKRQSRTCPGFRSRPPRPAKLWWWGDGGGRRLRGEGRHPAHSRCSRRRLPFAWGGAPSYSVHGYVQKP